MTRYSVHPVEQSYQDWATKQKAKRDDYWRALKRARNEYLQANTGNYDLTSRPTFHFFIEQHYGLKMGIDSLGEYTSEYQVVDPKKFMLFQIKYWN